MCLHKKNFLKIRCQNIQVFYKHYFSKKWLNKICLFTLKKLFIFEGDYNPAVFGSVCKEILVLFRRTFGISGIQL